MTLICAGARTAGQAEGAKPSGKYPLTMRDVIGMTRVAGPAYSSSSFLGGAPTREFASFSPDGKRFALVLRKGNLEDNTDTYSLFVVETDDLFRHPNPKLLLTFSSSSNREGIKQVSWLRDNDTILFLGENPGELTQLYEMPLSSRTLRRLTNHPTSVTSYSVSANGEQIVYAAEKPRRDLVTTKVIQHGFYVPSKIDLAELIAGRVLEGGSDGCELFAMKKGDARYEHLRVSGSLLFSAPSLSLSPDGKYLVVKTLFRDIDPAWKEYDSPYLQSMLARNLPKGSVTFIQGYELVDIASGKSKALMTGPVGESGSDLSWSPDSRSVIVSDVYLPLGVPNQDEREIRRKHTFVVEVIVANGQINKITEESLKPVGFIQALNAWKFETGESGDKTATSRKNIYYQKGPAAWTKMENIPEKRKQTEAEIFVDEDFNEPPRIIAKDQETGQRAVVLDLNPQLGGFALGKVEEIKWNDAAGHDLAGALYFPSDYVPDRRYPLVIQTHGYLPHRFWVDGPFTTAFAAQPLANNGIMVLQLPEFAAGTPGEGERNLRAFESSIDYLDRKGLVDVNRVGLVGFSRTCYHVKYTLTHSMFHFAAATVADGIDAGYFQFITFANEAPSGVAEIEMLVGASPFGEGQSVWMKNSPGFLLDRVETPVLIQATSLTSLLTEWEWFSGLSRLGKPVDFLYIPGGEHPLEKPWDRLTSQQNTVDWLVFWLKGEEDPDPAKAEQYKRWRELKQIQKENDDKAKAAPTN